ALGIAGTSVGMVRAQRAERKAVAQTTRAERLASFLANTIRSADPQLIRSDVLASVDVTSRPWDATVMPGGAWGSAGPAEVGVAGVLRHAAEHLGEEFGDAPELHAQVALLLARTLGALEDYDSALSLSDTALATQLQFLAPDDSAVIATRFLR